MWPTSQRAGFTVGNCGNCASAPATGARTSAAYNCAHRPARGRAPAPTAARCRSSALRSPMPRSRTPALLLVTPYLADANNGNWRTAARWARLLSPAYRVIVQAATAPVHGRRGRRCGRADRAARATQSSGDRRVARRLPGNARLIVALTGTDLYRDLPAGDAATRASLAMADRLLVLQDDAPRALPADRAPRRASSSNRRARSCLWPHKRSDRLHCVLVAHLREEKDPATAFAAWRLLPRDVAATLTIIGAALDPALGRAARDLAAADPRVQWLGPRDACVDAAGDQARAPADRPVAHGRRRERRGRGHHRRDRDSGDPRCRAMSACSATTIRVISRRPIRRSSRRSSPAHREDRAFLRELEVRCRRRAHLFTPEAEARALRQVVNEARALHGHRMSA